MNTENIVYLLRKTSLTLESIGKLTPAQFNAILGEAYFQEAVDEWRKQYSVASLMAAIYNTIPQKRGSKSFKADDFLKGDIPQRQSKPQDSLDKIAEDKGIKLPSKELRKMQCQ